MRALVDCELGVVAVDLEAEEVELEDVPDRLPGPEPPQVGLPLVVAADRMGPTVVAVVDRRPPVVISSDGGLTWKEAGAGLPPGRAVAISPEHPDLILFAGESRLFLSRDGGRFWSALAVELPGIAGIAWDD
ncbi:MAG TPA: sialidase family protein [Gaiellaceae bacterium]|jgi:hypothetical protein|nr:sialidase family protein [Gaiellaceae bacterium]